MPLDHEASKAEEKAAGAPRRGESASHPRSGPIGLLGLQHAAGNRAVAKMLARVSVQRHDLDEAAKADIAKRVVAALDTSPKSKDKGAGPEKGAGKGAEKVGEAKTETPKKDVPQDELEQDEKEDFEAEEKKDEAKRQAELRKLKMQVAHLKPLAGQEGKDQKTRLDRLRSRLDGAQSSGEDLESLKKLVKAEQDSQKAPALNPQHQDLKALLGGRKL